MEKYYCYRHIRLDTNQVFYVGVGKIYYFDAKTYEKMYHRAFAKTNRNTYWKNIVAKTKYRVEVFFTASSSESIKEKEIEFIALYGRTEDGGTLCNMTSGGEGRVDSIVTQETRRKMSEKRKGIKFSEDHKTKISQSKIGKPRSIDCKNKLSLTHKGKKASEGTKRKISESRKGIPQPHKAKQVLLLEEDVVFASIKDCAHYLGVKVTLIYSYFAGKTKNIRNKAMQRVTVVEFIP